MTHAVLDRDSDEAVIVVRYKSCQIGRSASLPVAAAVDPNEDGQGRIRVSSCRCEDLRGLSNGRKIAGYDIPTLVKRQSSLLPELFATV